ncbi:hypothetical protein ACFWUX_04970, partial [Streptomyces sp. NPDC058625]
MIMSIESGEPGTEEGPAGISAGARELSGVPSVTTGGTEDTSPATAGAGSTREAAAGSSPDSVRTGRYGGGSSEVVLASGPVEGGPDRSVPSDEGTRVPSGVTVAAGSSVVTASVPVEVVTCSPDGVVWGRCCGVAFGGAGAGEAVVEGVGVAAAGEPPGTGATGGARGPVRGSGCGVARSCWSGVTRVSGIRDVSGFLETSAEFSVSSASSASGVVVSSSAGRWRSGADRV